MVLAGGAERRVGGPAASGGPGKDEDAARPVGSCGGLSSPCRRSTSGSSGHGPAKALDKIVRGRGQCQGGGVRGDPAAAWAITEPKRITKEPYEEDLRQWYVAARAAVELGDTATARKLMDAIENEDAAFAGLDQLSAAITSRETA